MAMSDHGNAGDVANISQGSDFGNVRTLVVGNKTLKLGDGKKGTITANTVVPGTNGIVTSVLTENARSSGTTGDVMQDIVGD